MKGAYGTVPHGILTVKNDDGQHFNYGRSFLRFTTKIFLEILNIFDIAKFYSTVNKMSRKLFHKGSSGNTARFNHEKYYIHPKNIPTEWDFNKTFVCYAGCPTYASYAFILRHEPIG